MVFYKSETANTLELFPNSQTSWAYFCVGTTNMFILTLPYSWATMNEFNSVFFSFVAQIRSIKSRETLVEQAEPGDGNFKWYCSLR